jgi:hypothetical protein
MVACGAAMLFASVVHALAGTAPWFPDDASCRVLQAPADAGAVVTPGGFLLVHPRNDRLPADYDGCKTLWIVDEPEVPRRWSTLLFEGGRLRRAVLWQRDAPDVADRVCDQPGFDQSVALRAQPPCSGIDDNELVALHLASWPRICMTEPDREECRQDPR